MLRTNVLEYSIFNSVCHCCFVFVGFFFSYCGSGGFIWIYLWGKWGEWDTFPSHSPFCRGLVPIPNGKKNACYTCFLGPRPFAITSSSLLFHFIVLCLSCFRFSTFFTLDLQHFFVLDLVTSDASWSTKYPHARCLTIRINRIRHRNLPNRSLKTGSMDRCIGCGTENWLQVLITVTH